MDNQLNRKLIYNLLSDDTDRGYMIPNNINDLIHKIETIFIDVKIFRSIVLMIHSDTMKYSNDEIPSLDNIISIMYDLFEIIYPVHYSTFITSFCRCIHVILNTKNDISEDVKIIIEHMREPK